MCFLLIPDVILFVYLNVIIFKRSSHVCSGEYLTDEEIGSLEGFLPREEGKYLTISLILQWALLIFAILMCCQHVCYTFCFRV